MERAGGIQGLALRHLEAAERPLAPVDRTGPRIVPAGDLQGIELGDLDLDESESMGNTGDRVGKSDVTSQKTGKRPALDTPDKKVEEVYECEVCGLAVTVDEDCGCVETCDIICCGTPMKAKKAKAKAKAA